LNRLLKKKPAVATETNGAILSLRGVTRTYPTAQGGLTVLKGVDLEVMPGEVVGLIGPSGSGKSSLLHAAGLLERPTSGQVLIDGEDVGGLDERARTRLRLRRIGFVYQFHHLLPDFTAMENVAMPLLIGKAPKAETERRALAMLDAVGLAHRSNHRPSELSGGERQRVAIARALVNNPRLVLADEPTGNLDARNADSIFDLLGELNKTQGTAFLVVTHDLQLAKRLSRQLEMRDGHLNPELTLMGRA